MTPTAQSISVWFVCKLCADSFQTIEHFFEHKKQKHFAEFANLKCIVFEERTFTYDSNSGFVDGLRSSGDTTTSDTHASVSVMVNNTDALIVSPNNSQLRFDFDLRQQQHQHQHQNRTHRADQHPTVIDTNFDFDFFDPDFVHNGNLISVVTGAPSVQENAHPDDKQEDRKVKPTLVGVAINSTATNDPFPLKNQTESEPDSESPLIIFDMNFGKKVGENANSPRIDEFVHGSQVIFTEVQIQTSISHEVDDNRNYNQSHTDGIKECCKPEPEITEESVADLILLKSEPEPVPSLVHGRSNSISSAFKQQLRHPLECKFCHKIINSEALFKIHVIICAGYSNSNRSDETRYCSSQSLSYTHNGVQINNTKELESKLKCHFCAEDLVNRISFIRHLEAHHGKEKPFRCSQPGCSKSFMKRRYLSCHIKSHSNDKRRRSSSGCTDDHCNYGETFSNEKLNRCDGTESPGVKRQKEGSDEDSSKYRCEVCNKTFKYKSFYLTHSLVHTVDRPYKCTIAGCTSAFKRKFDFQKHERRHNAKQIRNFSI